MGYHREKSCRATRGHVRWHQNGCEILVGASAAELPKNINKYFLYYYSFLSGIIDQQLCKICYICVGLIRGSNLVIL